MGKETISSQELSDYTHVNSTQIRRDLSGFGKFGKRGVGYNVEALVSQIRKILRTAGQHNIALLGAGHWAEAIASSEFSPTTASGWWRSSTSTTRRSAPTSGVQVVRHTGELRQRGGGRGHRRRGARGAPGRLPRGSRTNWSSGA